MDTETLAQTTIGKLFVRVVAAGMESRFRARFFGAENILHGANLLPGQMVLEVGCGTGFFTLPAARLIGDQGCLVSLDILAELVEFVSQKVQAAALKNVRMVKASALSTGLDAQSFDAVLLFGVIPAPMLPLPALFAELQRVLKAGGTLSVWPPVPGWLPQVVLKSGLYSYAGKRGGVHNFRRG